MSILGMTMPGLSDTDGRRSHISQRDPPTRIRRSAYASTRFGSPDGRHGNVGTSHDIRAKHPTQKSGC